MAYYNVCKNCGCNLDPGEKCDCVSRMEDKRNEIEKRLLVDKKGQYRMNLEGMKYEKAVGY